MRQQPLSCVAAAAFALLLSRYSGQAEVVVGVANPARPAAAEELLPLRMRTSDASSFGALVAQVAAALEAGTAASSASFQAIVDAVAKAPASNFPPLVQACVTCGPAGALVDGLAGLEHGLQLCWLLRGPSRVPCPCPCPLQSTARWLR